MAKFFNATRPIIRDLGAGSNLELYVVVPIAVAAVILNLTGRAEWFLGPVMTTLLAVIAIGLLRSRHQQERLEALLRGLRVDDGLAARFFWEKHSIAAVQQRIEAAQGEVWLWGATLSRHVGSLEDFFVVAARKGVMVKVLLISADGDAMRMAATRAVTVPMEELQDELKANLVKLRRACRRINEGPDVAAGGGIEVRALDYLAPYTIYAYSPFAPTGAMELRLGGIQTQDDARAGFSLTAATDRLWYDRFRNQFIAAWEQGTLTLKSGS